MRLLKQCNIVASMLLSLMALGYALRPRIAAWSHVSNSNLIAQQRAASCVLLSGPIRLGQKTEVNPGRLACYWDGSTGEVGNDRIIRNIKNGNPEQIAKALESRGFKR